VPAWRLGPSQCWTGVVGSRSHGIPKALRGKTRRRLSSHNASASSWIRRFLPWPNQTAADPGPAQPRSPIYGQANSHARHGDTDHTRHGPDTQTGPHIIWRCVWISGVDFPAPSLLAPSPSSSRYHLIAHAEMNPPLSCRLPRHAHNTESRFASFFQYMSARLPSSC
jgi:hypothetical protein